MRDITLEETIYPRFTTRAFATGIPGTLGGSPVLSIYEENNTTQITAGVSVSVDYDSVTGLNQATIVATAANGYESGKSYDLVITTGTVDSVSVVGETVFSFTIGASAAAADLANGTDGLGAIKTDTAAVLVDTVDIQSRLPAALVGGLMSADMTAISTDSTAADNLELQYDTTGLSGDTFPATQLQVSGIGSASGGGARFWAPAEDNEAGAIWQGVTKVGTQVGGTYASAGAGIGDSHSIDDVGNDIDWVYGYDVGKDQVVTGVYVNADVDGGQDNLDLEAWNFTTSAWVAITNIDDNEDKSVPLTDDFRGTGANLGKVYLRFDNNNATTPANLEVFSLLVETVASATGIANGETITLSDTTNNTSYEGRSWNLVIDTQDIGGSYFNGCKSVTGIGTCSNGTETSWEKCDNINVTLTAEGVMRDCGFLSLTLTSSAGVTADKFGMFRSQSNVAGSGAPTTTLAAVTKETSFEARGWLGGGTWIFNSFCTASISVQDGGTHTITTGGGDVELRGKPKKVTITSSGTGTTNAHVITGAITIEGTGGTVNVTGLHAGITDNSGGSVTVNDNAGNVIDIGDILADTSELQTNQGNWLTATGFATEAKQDIIDTNIDQIETAVITNAAGVDIAADIIAIKAETAAIVDDTGTSGVLLAATATSAQLVDDTWDEILTGATHNTPTSAGRRLRELAGTIIISGTAATGTSNTITLDGDASTSDGAYDPAMVYIVAGTGLGQTRNILDYVGSTKIATVDRNWRTNPDATSEYIIGASAGREHVNEGLAQAGTSSTITLNTSASASDDAYISQTVFIRSGTGEDQARIVTDYNGTTKVATVGDNWATTPDTTSGYVMLPTHVYEVETIAEATRTEIDSNSTQLAAIVADTNELQTNQGNWLTATGFATSAALTTHDGKLDTVDTNVDSILIDTGTTLPARFTGVEGATFATGTDSLEAIRDRGDAAWTTGGGGSAPTEAEMYAHFTSGSNEDAFKADVSGLATAAALSTHDGKLDTVDTNVDSILVDTNTTLPASIATIDTNVDSVLVDTGTTIPATLTTIEGKIDTVDSNIDLILDDTGVSGVVISTATAQSIADEILKRSVSNTEDDAAEHSLTTIILAALESSLSGTVWTINQTDGSTTFTTKTVTVDAAADPITAVT